MARFKIFEDDADLRALERILPEAVERAGAQSLANFLMRDIWHLVVQLGQKEWFTFDIRVAKSWLASRCQIARLATDTIHLNTPPTHRRHVVTKPKLRASR